MIGTTLLFYITECSAYLGPTGFYLYILNLSLKYSIRILKLACYKH